MTAYIYTYIHIRARVAAQWRPEASYLSPTTDAAAAAASLIPTAERLSSRVWLYIYIGVREVREREAREKVKRMCALWADGWMDGRRLSEPLLFLWWEWRWGVLRCIIARFIIADLIFFFYSGYQYTSMSNLIIILYSDLYSSQWKWRIYRKSDPLSLSARKNPKKKKKTQSESKKRSSHDVWSRLQIVVVVKRRCLCAAFYALRVFSLSSLPFISKRIRTRRNYEWALRDGWPETRLGNRWRTESRSYGPETRNLSFFFLLYCVFLYINEDISFLGNF